MVTVVLEKAESFLLGLFFFLLPTQLAYHFWPEWSYFWGIRIDFLAPALFLIDIVFLLLCLVILIRHLVSRRHLSLKFPPSFYYLLSITAIVLIVNVCRSYQPWLSCYRLFRVLQLALVIIVLRRRFRPTLLRPLFFSLLVVSFLSWWQLLYQRSWGGVFYWLGERFFNSSTLGIAKMSLLGHFFLRPMATFSHPNSLAGFVLISLMIFWYFRHRLSRGWGILFYLGLVVIATNLLISFSGAVWLAGLVLVATVLVWPVKNSRLRFGLGLALVSLGCAAGYYWGLAETQSLIERWQLAKNAWQLINLRPIWGWGLGSFIPAQAELSFARSSFNFYQPVHNIFLLIMAEMGGLGLAISLLWLSRLWAEINQYWRLVLLLLILLGLLDHYWLTLLQNQLLLGVVIAAALVKKDN